VVHEVSAQQGHTNVVDLLTATYSLATDVLHFQRIVESLPFIVALYEVVEPDDYRTVAISPLAIQRGGFPDVVGKCISEFSPPEDLRIMQEIYGECRRLNEPIVQEVQVQSASGEHVWLSATTIPVQSANGEITHILTISNDITEQKQREEHQIRTLAELSTPLLKISNNTMVMPLIGVLDTQRVQMMINTLLHGVAESQAEIVIIDITGVPVVDTQVANTLIQAAQSVKLLGAQVILSGIRPEVAQILVSLGVDLSGIPTKSSLQAAIAFTLQ
jgi:rsbT co-antagonist protein RsbR